MTVRELVNLSQAAKRVSRPRKTVSGWVARGLLFPVGLDSDGHQLYDLAAVSRLAEVTSTRRRRRTRGGSTHG